MTAVGRVSRGSPVQTAMRNCTRDEGRSFEAGSQVLVSNRCKLLSSKVGLWSSIYRRPFAWTLGALLGSNIRRANSNPGGDRQHLPVRPGVGRQAHAGLQHIL